MVFFEIEQGGQLGLFKKSGILIIQQRDWVLMENRDLKLLKHY
jgi:hypothetical protein